MFRSPALGPPARALMRSREGDLSAAIPDPERLMPSEYDATPTQKGCHTIRSSACQSHGFDEHNLAFVARSGMPCRDGA